MTIPAGRGGGRRRPPGAVASTTLAPSCWFAVDFLLTAALLWPLPGAFVVLWRVLGGLGEQTIKHRGRCLRSFEDRRSSTYTLSDAGMGQNTWHMRNERDWNDEIYHHY